MLTQESYWYDDLEHFRIIRKKTNAFKLALENNTESSYYCASIILSKKLKKSRFKIILKLKNSGIGTSIHYPKIISDYTYYKQKYKINSSNFPNASTMSYRSINLPVGPHLTKKDLLYMASKIKEIFKKFI